MGAVFNDFLHQTISASTIVAGTCYLLQKIPVPQIPEIEKLKRISLGIGTTATAIYAIANSNNRIKKLVLGIRLAAIGSTLHSLHYAYNLIPKRPVKTPPPAPLVKPSIVKLGTAIAATTQTAQSISNVVPNNIVPATPPILPPAAIIKPRIDLGKELAATAKNAYNFLTSKQVQQIAKVAAIAITIHTLYNLVRGSNVAPPPPPPPPPPAVTPPRITQGTQTGLYTERSTEEIANLALISMMRQNMQTPADIDQWIQRSAANAAPAPVLGATIITRLVQIPTPQIAGTNTFDFTRALQATLAEVQRTGRAQGGLLRINGLYKCIVVAPSINAGHFVYRYFNPIASFHSNNAGIMEMGDLQQFTNFLNKQAQPFWATDPPTTVCECIPCTVPP